ncbi:C2 and GRAM domain-containing protein [Musa troglodytarum]|uniref:C2 and GRAM domain-containing protein n=1 Tax=Musa troglodytarum TaxID=320322 RepID=A0A9E7GIL9_9LILI|nr:C2 and GRAM domain-containing protein [Musa troglodytarum]
MRLFVHVAEARGLAWPPSRAASPPGVYAKIKAGNHKSRTRAVTGTPDPVWNEEFAFWMGEDEEEEEGTVELKLSVFREGGGDGGGGGGAELLGSMRVYVEEEAEAKPPICLSLQPRRHRGAKSKGKDCGIVSLSQ